MDGLHNYMVWNPNLSQFVAQPDLRSEDDIRALGGVVIASGGHPAPSHLVSARHAVSNALEAASP